MNGDRYVFEVKGVSYSCLDKFPALCDVSLEIGEKESIVLLGANGSGKSSLLHILNGLVFPQKGEVLFQGKRLTEESLGDEEFNGFFRKTVGLIFQNSDVQLFSPTVWDEIAFGPTQLGLSKEEVEGRVFDLMRMLKMENLKDRPPFHLSGGEKKKVAIASTLAVNPDILLLDEPTNGLDPRTQAWLIELLQELRNAGKTIVMASHDLLVVEKISDRVVVMGEDHRIAAAGNTSDILSDRDLLLEVNLIHEHIHFHGDEMHSHDHGHLTDHDHDRDEAHVHDHAHEREHDHPHGHAHDHHHESSHPKKGR